MVSSSRNESVHAYMIIIVICLYLYNDNQIDIVLNANLCMYITHGDGCGRHLMVLGCITTYALSANHGEMYSIQHYVIIVAGQWVSPDNPVSSTMKCITTI